MTTAEAPRRLKKYTYRRPILYKKQSDAVFDPARFSHIEASPKSGKTMGCIAWIIEQALENGRVGRQFWWVAPTYVQSRIAYRRAKRGLKAQLYKANETDLTLTLFNGAVLWFKSGEKPDNLYGEDVWAVVIDEASRCREEVWTAIRTTLTYTRGPCRFIGNVKGRKNWAYRMARRAQAGAPDSAYHKITAQDAIDAGVLVQEEIDAARLDMPQAVAQELFDVIASDDEGNPFNVGNVNYIRQCIRPLAQGPAVIWGWDLGRKQDWTCGVGLNVMAQVCAFERFQMPWEETLDRIKELIGSTKAVVDATGVGDPICERLIRAHYRVETYIFTSPSKQLLMEGLAVAIQSSDISYPDGVMVGELESFEYVYTRTGVKYSAPVGQWDDTVCALGLAVYGAVFGKVDLEVPVPTYPDQPAGDNRGVATLGNF